MIHTAYYSKDWSTGRESEVLLLSSAPSSADDSTGRVQGYSTSTLSPGILWRHVLGNGDGQGSCNVLVLRRVFILPGFIRSGHAPFLELDLSAAVRHLLGLIRLPPGWFFTCGWHA